MTHFSEEFEVNVGVHQASASSAVLLDIVIYVAMNEIKEGTLHEILYVNDIVLIAEAMAELQEKLYTWESALKSKGLKVNQERTKVMVSKIGQVTINPSSKKDPCGICGKKTMVNTVLCLSCGNWIHGGCAKIKNGNK